MKLLTTISNDLKQSIIEAMVSGSCTTVDDIVEQFNLSTYSAVALLNDNEFLVTVSQYSQAQAKLYFHSKGIKKIMRIADEGDDKTSIQAIKIIGEYSNDLKKKSGDINVNVSLEQQIRMEEEKEKNVTPNSVIDLRSEAVEIKSLPSAMSRPEDSFNIEELESEDMEFADLKNQKEFQIADRGINFDNDFIN